jgi:hypothetical protein
MPVEKAVSGLPTVERISIFHLEDDGDHGGAADPSGISGTVSYKTRARLVQNDGKKRQESCLN